MDIRRGVEFWPEIMRDHEAFKYTILFQNEIEAINTAMYFKNLFVGIYREAQTGGGKLVPKAL